MDREEIKKHIPHRSKMLLLDKCEDLGGGKSYGEYKVKGDEFFLDGHFPDFKVVPGVILCEIMAQSSFPIFLEEISGNVPMYAGIKNAKFKRRVRPGDEVKVNCVAVKKLRPFYTIKSELSVGGKLCATAEMMFCLVDSKSLKK